MAINEELKQGLVKQTEASMKGEVVFIKNTIDRASDVFNFMQSRFTLIGAQSGVGKSSFVDDTYILKVWDQVKELDDVHWEVLYYSMERKKMFKHAKWMSWFLYRDQKWQLNADIILGWDSRGVINAQIKSAFDSHLEEMSDLLDRVDIYDGRTSVLKIAKQITKKARQLGVLYRADGVGVSVDDESAYRFTFAKDGKVRSTRHGDIKYIDFEHNGEQYSVDEGKHIYITKKKHTFLFIVLDGIGLIDKTGYKSTKEAVDAVVNLLSDARDIYGFSPIVVSQFNRGISDIHRIKQHGSSNEPQESDFKDSSNQFQAADVVIALFDPVRAKAYNDNGMYQGYNVTKGMRVDRGPFRFRSIKLLKNSFGVDNVTLGMKFLGEVNYFETLPPPFINGDTPNPELEAVYAQIFNGK